MRKAIAILSMIFAVVALILSMVLFSKDAGTYVRHIAYGGDAYTGIQNAAADTAVNVKWLNEAVSFGFGAVLLMVSFAFLLVSVYFFGSEKGTPMTFNDVGMNSQKSVETTQSQEETVVTACVDGVSPVLDADTAMRQEICDLSLEELIARQRQTLRWSKRYRDLCREEMCNRGYQA